MKYTLIFLIIILMASCSQGCDKQEKVIQKHNSVSRIKKNLNISIFVDLSDRISPAVNDNSNLPYYQRDLGYLRSIANAFELHCMNTKLGLMNEKLQLFVDPLPMNPKINDYIRKLRFQFSKNNVSKESIEGVDSIYNEMATKLYEQTIEDNTYVGSDIWGFFKNKVKDYCVSPDHRNILFILTDGYAYHQDNLIREGNQTSYLTTKLIRQLQLNNSNWGELLKTKNCGFLVSDSTLSNLEVMVLGINPGKNNPYEQDVMETYWSQWLSSMGVEKYEIMQTDLPVNLDAVIQNFILKP